jgi:hypothetical protein
MKKQQKSFEEQNEENGNGNILKEFLDLLGHNKKWWITPIIIVLLILGLIIIAGGSSFSIFMYPI